MAAFCNYYSEQRELKQFGRNDLQQVATRLYPQVAKAIEWLAQFGDARMTGSGACVFCAFPDEGQADAVLEQARGAWTAWKAKSLKKHPLAAKLI